MPKTLLGHISIKVSYKINSYYEKVRARTQVRAGRIYLLALLSFRYLLINKKTCYKYLLRVNAVVFLKYLISVFLNNNISGFTTGKQKEKLNFTIVHTIVHSEIFQLGEERRENIATGDKKDFSETYIFYYKKLFNYGRKFTDDLDLIEDSVNEVFITLWKNRLTVHTIHFPQSYIFTSFRNKIIQKIKSLRLLHFREAAYETEIQFSIDSIIIQQETDIELKKQLGKAIQQLTHRQQEAVFLRFYEGLSYAEIAAIMNISVKVTYKLMARALNEMKDILSIPIIKKLFL